VIHAPIHGQRTHRVYQVSDVVRHRVDMCRLCPSVHLDTSIQLRNLNLNHIYAVRVRAENMFGVSDPSQPVTSRLLTRSTSMNERHLFDIMTNIVLVDERRNDAESEPIGKTRRPLTSAYDDYAGHLFSLTWNEHCQRVLVRLGSRPSLQVDGPDIQYFLEGQNARITMLLVGHPVPDITWYHDVRDSSTCRSSYTNESRLGNETIVGQCSSEDLQRSSRLRVSIDRIGVVVGRRRL
jgi:hypothetical protein